MAVPDYQTFMLPLLRLASDGREHGVREAIDRLAEEFHLTPEDRNELLPSGRQSKFDNRVRWASSYLKKARLIEAVGRGRFRITQRGQDVLKENPARVDVKLLSRFPEFVAFRSAVPSESPEVQPEEVQEKETPEEMLDASYQALRRELSQEVLERVRKCSPVFFERLVVELLVAMGYGGSLKDAGQAVGRTGDGGIDGIIKEDKLGLDVVYVQAKRWDGTVGRPVVQAFAGSLEGQRARKGVLITTSQFSQDAKDFVNRIEKKIVLIDGSELAQLMIDHGIGVTEVAAYSVKRIDSDYFEEDQ